MRFENFTRLLCVGGLLFLSLGQAQSGKEIVDPDSLSLGLETSTVIEKRKAPCGYRVRWIKWDSGFRGILEVGDRIIGIDGKPIECPPQVFDSRDPAFKEIQKFTQRAIGGISESLVWKELGKQDGTTVKLNILRRPKSGNGLLKLELSGKVRAERNYFSDNDKPTLGLGAPTNLERDNFSSVWSSWYEDFIRRAERVLDHGWVDRMNSRQLLSEWLEEKPRIDLLKQKYSGAFAEATVDDWQRVLAILAGGDYKITAQDLEYRQLGEKRSAQIQEAGKLAYQTMQKKFEALSIAPFPGVNPLENRAKVVGKVVVLPKIKPRDWVMEGGRCYLRSGDHQQGFYFIACQSPAIVRLFEAQERYQRFVNPGFLENYSFIAKILDQPKLLVVDGRAGTGLMLEPLGVMVEDKMFVDLSLEKEGVSQFAGEANLSSERLQTPAKTANPREVMEALIKALKWGDQNLWNSLFAESSAWIDESGRPRYSLRNTNSMDNDWIRSRRSILERLVDIRVEFVGDVEVILDGSEFAGAPRIEEVSVELRHIGNFDNVYRAFVDISVHPLWILQRINGGAWKIISEQEI